MMHQQDFDRRDVKKIKSRQPRWLLLAQAESLATHGILGQASLYEQNCTEDCTVKQLCNYEFKNDLLACEQMLLN